MSEVLAAVPLSGPDLLIVALVGIYMIYGFINGFLDGAVRLVSLVAIVLMFTHGAELLIDAFDISLGMPALVDKFVVALAGGIPIYVASLFARSAVTLIPASGAGKAFGIGVGFLRGSVAVIVLVYTALLLPSSMVKPYLDDSLLLQPFATMTEWVAGDLISEKRNALGTGSDIVSIDDIDLERLIEQAGQAETEAEAEAPAPAEDATPSEDAEGAIK